MRAGAALLAALLTLAAGPAPADRSADLAELRRAIEESRERVDRYERQQRGLLEAVEALDRSAALLAGNVERARLGAQEARTRLAALERESRGIEERLAATRRAMAARADALYRAGELGSLRLLFTSDGLPDFLSRMATLRRLLGHDAELLERHRSQSEALARARREANDTAQRLARAETELAQRSAELADERERKRQLVRRLHADRAGERAALGELENAARALEETLSGLDAGSAEGSPPPPGFAALAGRLDPPVSAPVVRAFGRVVDAEFKTETFHPGVLFAAPAGTPVVAVAAGRVRFAGWFRGYGRMVILEHGDGFFSVSGHLAELRVAVGESVAARQRVGTVGESGSLAGPRLYFEIRRGGAAVDPAGWLRPQSAR